MPAVNKNMHRIRNGLGAIGRKLRKNASCTIAYLGGSITWGGNASDVARFSYRARTTAFLRERYPSCDIREVDAGIGGTGSDLGVFRLAEDVLKHSPDLIFIEFAVNDTGRPVDDVADNIEGIVRQILHEKTPADICFIHTLARDHMPAIEKDELPPSVAAHEKVAAHYGIPSINVAWPVAQKILCGELEWAAFAGDAVHPTDFGHELYAKTIAECMIEFFQSPEASPTLPPSALSSRGMESARTISVPVEPNAFAGWTYRPLQKRGGWDCFNGVVASNQPGSEARFDFNGTLVGLYYLLGPESGDLAFSIDGEPFQELRVFDQWALDVWRPHYRILKSGLKPGDHQLRVRVSEHRDPRSTGQWTKLAYVLCV